MKARQEFTDRTLNESFKIFYSNFLTESEMEDVIDGKDMWMGKAEVLARLAGTFQAEETEATTVRRGRKRKVD